MSYSFGEVPIFHSLASSILIALVSMGWSAWAVLPPADCQKLLSQTSTGEAPQASIALETKIFRTDLQKAASLASDLSAETHFSFADLHKVAHCVSMGRRDDGSAGYLCDFLFRGAKLSFNDLQLKEIFLRTEEYPNETLAAQVDDQALEFRYLPEENGISCRLIERGSE